MAVLVVFNFDAQHPSYDELDLIDVLPAGTSPGDAVEANTPVRFGFFYIVDIDVDDPLVLELRGALVSDTPNEVGDYEVISKRKNKVRTIQGNIKRFETYHPWGADGSSVSRQVKFTAAQVTAFLENKGII